MSKGIKYAIVWGNVVAGFGLEGPFDTHEAANTYAENVPDDDEWEIHEIREPVRSEQERIT